MSVMHMSNISRRQTNESEGNGTLVLDGKVDAACEATALGSVLLAAPIEIRLLTFKGSLMIDPPCSLVRAL